MITDPTHAVAVQTRRRLSGKKGRAKAVRRWVKREFGLAIDACPGIVSGVLREALEGDFTGCERGSGIEVCPTCMHVYAASREVCPHCTGASE